MSDEEPILRPSDRCVRILSKEETLALLRDGGQLASGEAIAGLVEAGYVVAFIDAWGEMRTALTGKGMAAAIAQRKRS